MQWQPRWPATFTQAPPFSRAEALWTHSHQRSPSGFPPFPRVPLILRPQILGKGGHFGHVVKCWRIWRKTGVAAAFPTTWQCCTGAAAAPFDHDHSLTGYRRAAAFETGYMPFRRPPRRKPDLETSRLRVDLCKRLSQELAAISVTLRCTPTVRRGVCNRRTLEPENNGRSPHSSPAVVAQRT